MPFSPPLNNAMRTKFKSLQCNKISQCGGKTGNKKVTLYGGDLSEIERKKNQGVEITS